MSTEFRPPSLALTTLGLALAIFMQVLDTTIANVALPTIAGNLGVSANQGTWVITSFAVSQAISLPLTGFLSRRFGEVPLFIGCSLLFVVASFLCGVSQDMGMLILFRALQGAVAGPMYPITQSLMISIYPPHKRGTALALLSMVAVVAPITGPILGGWITDNYSWPWIFFINLPIGAFAVFVVSRQMRGRPERLQRTRIDYVGLATLVIGVGALQILLDKGNDEDWFSSPFIIACAVVAVISLAAFLIWELTEDEPVVDLRLFRHHNFRYGTLALVLSFSAYFAINLLLPQWLQRNLGYTATWAGLAAAPLGIAPLLLSLLVGRYAANFDLRLVASVAFVAMGATCFLRSDFTLDIDFRHIALMQALMGVGVALFFMPTTVILLSDLEAHEIAAGSGLSTFLRTLAGSFSASLTTFLWDRRAVLHHAQLSESITTFDSGTRNSLELLGQGDPQLGASLLNQMITQQAYQISFNELFHALGWIFLILMSVIWLTRPPFSGKARVAVADH
ncbi:MULTISPECIES: DHA2 family efflux MFS transporter permease subunit [unclassified Pseudomonas]|uniref:DHA2 family efflux MFS transporter permease subunit n=1 Tax=unclassified Pseudomonas TaxID=196821 RepID=UPI0004D92595|nr:MULTISPECIES: DHA2 family efflux MFS transporter permease subunit [unclassified Pseudomonas]KES21289.1 multidrug resistance protein B [Pseudomonas sp. AAC]OHR95593.1 multidrug resistance protein B [Pseudomonas sp. HMSC75E02]